MQLSPPIKLDGLLPNLDLLCREPSVSGHSRSLTGGAQAVASILRGYGLDAHVVATAGAPIVIGRFDAGVRRTLLIYGHYDVAPLGVRRDWTREPFQLSEQDGLLYGRGVIAKAEFVARAAAVGTLIEHRSLPFNIWVVIEGEYQTGSAHLPAIAVHVPPVDVALWNGGDVQANGLPLMYSGVKGLLQAEVRADGPNQPLPLRYAASVPNPIWSLTWALGSIKSEFEELLPEGFYDDVQPPDRVAMSTIQGLEIGEAERRRSWNIERFVTNMSGSMLLRTESFSPTCNISHFTVEAGELPALPKRATAILQFQLVPDQQPDLIWEQLQAHVDQHQWNGLQLIRLPGSYAGRPASGDEAWSDAAMTASETIYGSPGRVVPLAPYTSPVSILAGNAPLVGAGLLRPDSATFGPNERLPVLDLERHAQFIAEWIVQAAAG